MLYRDYYRGKIRLVNFAGQTDALRFIYEKRQGSRSIPIMKQLCLIPDSVEYFRYRGALTGDSYGLPMAFVGACRDAPKYP